MTPNVLRSALRAARRRPGFTALNVAGLALGLACCLLIALYVRAETTVDAHHDRADRIVRVTQQVADPGREALWAWTGGAMGEDLGADFPQVEAVVRVLRQAGPVRSEAHPDRRFREEAFAFADPALFDVFSYRFLRGDAATALRQPNAVVLTASTAARYFGDADPVGQTLTYGGTYGGRLPLVVSGVVEDPPATSLPWDLVAADGRLQVAQRATGRRGLRVVLVAPGVDLPLAPERRRRGRPPGPDGRVQRAPPRGRGGLPPDARAARRRPL